MADFIEEDLSGSRFERVNLAGSRFERINLSGAEFRASDIVELSHAKRVPGGKGSDAPLPLPSKAIHLNG
jgi:hypothetical protein